MHSPARVFRFLIDAHIIHRQLCIVRAFGPACVRACHVADIMRFVDIYRTAGVTLHSNLIWVILYTRE